MKALTAKPLGLAVVGAFIVAAVVLGVGSLSLAASGKAEFSLGVSSSSATIQQGQSTSLAVTESIQNGFKDGVALTSSGLPGGVSASFSPTIIDKPTTPATLTISASTSAATGTYTMLVTGTSGSLTHSYPISLTINALVAPKFTLFASPRSTTMLPGDTSVYTVSVSRTAFTSAVAFVVSGLPGNTTASFTPASTTGNTSSLQVVTKNNTPTGIYTLTITGTAAGQPNQTDSVSLNLSGTGKDFTISSTIPPGLVPGGSGALNLSVTNLNRQNLIVTNLTVSVQSVTPPVVASGTCTAGDFAVTQLDATRYPLTIPAGATPAGTTRSLSQLGVLDAQLPHILMLDRPVDQNGCVGASYSLTFSGAAHG